MILRVFTIYDSKAMAYLQPFFMMSKGEAVRAVTELCNDPKHNFCKYAEDFTLFELGDWDNESASFVEKTTPHSLGVLVEYKKDVPSV